VFVDDAPAVMLYEPRLVAGASKRIKLVELRPDAWWSGLADWSIPADQRIDRDRVGLRAATQ
jgi:peptide/nickel transport system substrate-binding protein